VQASRRLRRTASLQAFLAPTKMTRGMRRSSAVAAVLSALALTGCGSESKSDAVKEHLLDGVTQIRDTHDRKKLRSSLVQTLGKLRRDDVATSADRRGRAFAIQGFTWTVRGIDSQIDFIENDRGNIEAATRDAKRAYSSLTRGADDLRAAGRVFGLQFGTLNGY
jgi:outer membrane murein-binding lipoprotein Lpp